MYRVTQCVTIEYLQREMFYSFPIKTIEIRFQNYFVRRTNSLKLSSIENGPSQLTVIQFSYATYYVTLCTL